MQFARTFTRMAVRNNERLGVLCSAAHYFPGKYAVEKKKKKGRRGNETEEISCGGVGSRMQAPSHETLKGTRSERVSLIGFVRGKKKKKREGGFSRPELARSRCHCFERR